MEPSDFTNAVIKELGRQVSLGYTSSHDFEFRTVDELLDMAYSKLEAGMTVQAGALIRAARRLNTNISKKNPMQTAVEAFMIACEQEVKRRPDLPDDQVRMLRIRLMVEELLGSSKSDIDNFNYSSPYFQFVRGRSDELVKSMMVDDLVGVADGLADLLYVVFGTAAAYGINIQEVFDEVHRSNMSKTVWNEEIGKFAVIKNEAGKVMKPDTFSPARIEPILESQITRGRTKVEYVGDFQ